MGTDALSAVLRDMRLESAGYRYLRLTAPWNLGFVQKDLRGVHIVVAGRCELVVDGEVDRILEAGDLVVLPQADPHSLCSPGARHFPPIADAARTSATGRGALSPDMQGGSATILCGAFVFHDADLVLLSALPRVIHVPTATAFNSEGQPSWLAAYIDALTSEATIGGAGSAIVMARLSDALVARALRFHADNAPAEGWLNAVKDMHLGRAIAAIHESCERPWSLAALARTAGLSRAAFAARFKDKVGESAMRYLMRCRMRRAANLLVEEGATLARTAERVGYGSEAAFSAAFKRHTGLSPGAFRRANIVRGLVPRSS